MAEGCPDCGVYATELASVEAERDSLQGEVEALEYSLARAQRQIGYLLHGNTYRHLVAHLRTRLASAANSGHAIKRQMWADELRHRREVVEVVNEAWAESQRLTKQREALKAAVRKVRAFWQREAVLNGDAAFELAGEAIKAEAERDTLRQQLEESRAVTGRYADACELEHRQRLVAEGERDALKAEMDHLRYRAEVAEEALAGQRAENKAIHEDFQQRTERQIAFVKRLAEKRDRWRGTAGLMETQRDEARAERDTLGGRIAELERGCRNIALNSPATQCEQLQALADQPTPDPRHPEDYCHRCGGPNASWYAPSPLWNAVMRPHGEASEQWSIICPTCFMVLAEQAGIADTWRLDAKKVLVKLATTCPDGRVWDVERDLWVEPAVLAGKPAPDPRDEPVAAIKRGVLPRPPEFDGIQARQYGRKSPNGPQPGQETVSVLAFTLAMKDIDFLLGYIDKLEIAARDWMLEARNIAVRTGQGQGSREARTVYERCPDCGAERPRGLDCVASDCPSAFSRFSKGQGSGADRQRRLERIADLLTPELSGESKHIHLWKTYSVGTTPSLWHCAGCGATREALPGDLVDTRGSGEGETDE